MTMLDRMRRHRNWLKWSLALVCLAFVIFYIPDFLRGSGADAASSDMIARVEGHDITAGEFRRTYQAQLQAYRSAYGANMNEQLRLCELWLRDVLCIRQGAPELVHALDRGAQLGQDAHACDSAPLRRGMELIADTRLHLALNVSEELALEALAYRLEELLAPGA